MIYKGLWDFLGYMVLIVVVAVTVFAMLLPHVFLH